MMSNVVKAGNLLLGDGMPKICVPIVEDNHDNILKMAKTVYESAADMVEWRVDFYKDFHNIDAVNKTLICVKEILKEKPLLFTFRTAHEGGKEDISYGEYSALLKEAAAEFTGSAVTFGCIGTPSAPGQIEANTLRKVMDILHCNQERK